VAEVWINGVSQGSQASDNNLPTDDTALPFSIGVMVGNDNYKSALKFANHHYFSLSELIIAWHLMKSPT
jgi:hypothetical protein